MGGLASSALLLVPTLRWDTIGFYLSDDELMIVFRRAVLTRAPIPISLVLLATASTGYYVQEFKDRHP